MSKHTVIARIPPPKLPRRSMYQKPGAAETGRELMDLTASLAANLKLSPPIDETVICTLTPKQRQMVASMIKEILRTRPSPALLHQCGKGERHA